MKSSFRYEVIVKFMRIAMTVIISSILITIRIKFNFFFSTEYCSMMYFIFVIIKPYGNIG